MPPRFQRLRHSRLIRALKWLFTHPFFWVMIIIVIILNWSYGQLVPYIVSVPFIRQGSRNLRSLRAISSINQAV